MRTSTALRFAYIVAVLFATSGVGAETTYRWIDPGSGHTVISDLPPPPGARQVIHYTTNTGVGEPQIPYAVRQATEKFPVVLYTSLGCVTCKEARALLDRRGVPFSERAPNSEEELAELARQLGEKLCSPASVSAGKASEAFHPPRGSNSSTPPVIHPPRPIACDPPKPLNRVIGTVATSPAGKCHRHALRASGEYAKSRGSAHAAWRNFTDLDP